MNFTKQELIDMIYTLGESDRNCFLASRNYAQKYPDRAHPQEASFKNLKNRFEETGDISYKKNIVQKGLQMKITNTWFY